MVASMSGKSLLVFLSRECLDTEMEFAMWCSIREEIKF